MSIKGISELEEYLKCTKGGIIRRRNGIIGIGKGDMSIEILNMFGENVGHLRGLQYGIKGLIALKNGDLISCVENINGCLIHVWCMKEKNQKLSIWTPNRMLCFLKIGENELGGCKGDRLFIWNIRTGNLSSEYNLFISPHSPTSLSTFAFSGQTLIAGATGQLLFWDISTLHPALPSHHPPTHNLHPTTNRVCNYYLHAHKINNIFFGFSEGDILYSTTNTLSYYNHSLHKKRYLISTGNNSRNDEGIGSFNVLERSRKVGVGCQKGDLRILNGDNYQFLESRKIYSKSIVSIIELVADIIFTISIDWQMKIIDINTFHSKFNNSSSSFTSLPIAVKLYKIYSP